VPARDLHKTPAAFRRVSNLFEIVPFAYWSEERGFQPAKDVLDWQESYLADPDGERHVRRMLEAKLPRLGIPIEEVRRLSLKGLRGRSLPFFAGSHELIIPRRHLIPDA